MAQRSWVVDLTDEERPLPATSGRTQHYDIECECQGGHREGVHDRGALMWVVTDRPRLVGTLRSLPDDALDCGWCG
jgi:hypothetical protein